jgi:hypothetical protein
MQNEVTMKDLKSIVLVSIIALLIVANVLAKQTSSGKKYSTMSLKRTEFSTPGPQH